MGKRFLVVGGAGFIGSHLADELLQHGHEVRVYDALVPQVHGDGEGWPAYLTAAVDAVCGDARDGERLGQALAGVDGVFHLAARVGSGFVVKAVASADDRSRPRHVSEAVDIASLLSAQLDQRFEIRVGDGRPPASCPPGAPVWARSSCQAGNHRSRF